MSGYTLRPRAERDLSDIWDYTASTWSVEQAEAYVGILKAAIEHLAADPTLGRDASSLRPGYFRLSVGSHVVFFTKRRHGIEVVRVLHARMDLGRHL